MEQTNTAATERRNEMTTIELTEDNRHTAPATAKLSHIYRNRTGIDVYVYEVDETTATVTVELPQHIVHNVIEALYVSLGYSDDNRDDIEDAIIALVTANRGTK